LDVNLIDENPRRPVGSPPETPHPLLAELFELGMAIDLIGNAAAGRLGINQTDLICLNLLVRRGPMSAGDVAAELGLTTAAISAMATRLEASGYARREMDPKDRRRVLLHASPEKAFQAFGLFEDLSRGMAELTSSYDQRDLRIVGELIAGFRRLIVEQATVIRAETPSPRTQRRE
jgi:DNA-binding MarR family transcriptional regulator